jgi:hypothetical protein
MGLDGATPGTWLDPRQSHQSFLSFCTGQKEINGGQGGHESPTAGCVE